MSMKNQKITKKRHMKALNLWSQSIIVRTFKTILFSTKSAQNHSQREETKWSTETRWNSPEKSETPYSLYKRSEIKQKSREFFLNKDLSEKNTTLTQDRKKKSLKLRNRHFRVRKRSKSKKEFYKTFLSDCIIVVIIIKALFVVPNYVGIGNMNSSDSNWSQNQTSFPYRSRTK